MTACAALTIAAYNDKALSTSQAYLFVGGILGSLATGIFSYLAGGYAERANFVDVPCRKTYAIPVRLIQVSTAVYVLVGGSVFLYIFLSLASHRLGKRIDQAVNKIDTVLGHTLFWTELILMWATLGLIIFVRQSAKQIFGSSYQVSLLDLSLYINVIPY